MLRIGGFALANAGHDTRAIQDWLGHRSIQHTVKYTELAPTRFKDFWPGLVPDGGIGDSQGCTPSATWDNLYVRSAQETSSQRISVDGLPSSASHSPL